MSKSGCDRFQYPRGACDDFGADAVAGQ